MVNCASLCLVSLLLALPCFASLRFVALCSLCFVSLHFVLLRFALLFCFACFFRFFPLYFALPHDVFFCFAFRIHFASLFMYYCSLLCLASGSFVLLFLVYFAITCYAFPCSSMLCSIDLCQYRADGNRLSYSPQMCHLGCVQALLAGLAPFPHPPASHNDPFFLCPN